MERTAILPLEDKYGLVQTNASKRCESRTLQLTPLMGVLATRLAVQDIKNGLVAGTAHAAEKALIPNP